VVLKRELCMLCQQIFVVNGVCADQKKAMMAMLNLQSLGITEEQILYMNKLLESTRYNVDMNLTAELDY
jgi:hypothetical protein